MHQHKTNDKFGADFIHLTKDTYTLMKVFGKFYRLGHINNFFLNSKGEAYNTPSLLSITKHLWKKSNISKTDFAFGKVRHTIVTHIHSTNSQYKERLAQQMQHSASTASKYYKDRNSTKQAQDNFTKVHDELNKPKKRQI